MDNVLNFNDTETKQNSHLPVLDRITPDDLFSVGMNTEKLSKLENTCFDKGISQKAYEELLYVFDNFKTLDLAKYYQKVKMGINTVNFGVNSANFINALSYYLYTKTRGGSPEIVFFSYSNSKDNDGKVKHEYTFDCEAFALFVFTEFYKDILMLSAKEQGSSSPYYFYREENYRWVITGDKFLKNKMKKQVTTLMKLLGFRTEATKNAKKIADEIISLIETIDDEELDAIMAWTLKHPDLVQFKDTVYDIKNHAIAKMSPKFMLFNYHDYRLPIESVNLDELTEEDGFVPLKETMEEMEEKSKLVIDRMTILTKEKEFMTTVIGNGFCHNNEFLVFPILEGGAGLGKSWFFDVLKESLYMSRNSSGTGQDDLEKSGDFFLSNMFGKEFNLMGELNGSFMSKNFIYVIKSKLSDGSEINKKNKQQFDSKVYTQVVALANKGQAPAVPDNFVNDDGLQRRVVYIECNEKSKQPNELDTKKFTKEALSEKMPYFALFSMMKFQQHRDNGNILKFTREVSGASKYPIEGFTSQEMVDSTSSYFKQQDRKRKFFLHLYTIFVSRSLKSEGEKHDHPNLPMRDKSFFPTDAKLVKDDSSYDKLEKFKIWLKYTSSANTDDHFFNFFDTNYPDAHMTKDKLGEFLKTQDIKKGSVKYRKETKKGKMEGSVQGYGKKFADYVESIFLEEPEGKAMLEEPIFFDERKKSFIEEEDTF